MEIFSHFSFSMLTDISCEELCDISSSKVLSTTARYVFCSFPSSRCFCSLAALIWFLAKSRIPEVSLSRRPMERMRVSSPLLQEIFGNLIGQAVLVVDSRWVGYHAGWLIDCENILILIQNL